MTIRRAELGDIQRLNELLYEVAQVHAAGRPDIFKPASKKYTDEELKALLCGEETPIFVAVNADGYVLGYAFCVHKNTTNDGLLQDRKTLYIDDLCVETVERGKHVGRSLYEYVVQYAKAQGFDSITLNVWAFNESAYAFYEHCGMTPQRIIMEKNLQERKGCKKE